MSQPTLTVCVYCSSSEAVDPAYRRVAAEFGRALAAQGWGLVYGGGNVGLMGEVARAALVAGAPVIGVIPHQLAVREMALEEVTELIRTDTMRERKAIMDERSDAFVVLPGGVGTLEELVEILTLKQLGYHDRAIVILDSKGYWDPLLGQLERMIDERLAYPELRDLIDVTHDVAETVEALRGYRPPPPRHPMPVQLEAAEPPRRGLGA
ncbi:MAG: TIGR00730 family Rossman fold protein [Actinomycetota bacterium]|nr:TIGR00730 family Rossman fold protein [Actinomycetota bacterium]